MPHCSIESVCNICNVCHSFFLRSRSMQHRFVDKVAAFNAVPFFIRSHAAVVEILWEPSPPPEPPFDYGSGSHRDRCDPDNLCGVSTNQSVYVTTIYLQTTTALKFRSITIYFITRFSKILTIFPVDAILSQWLFCNYPLHERLCSVSHSSGLGYCPICQTAVRETTQLYALAIHIC